MENMSELNNLHPAKIREDMEMYDTELECKSNEDTKMSLPECTKIKTQVDLLKGPSPILEVNDKSKSDVSEYPNQDYNTSTKYASGTSDVSTSDNIKTQIHDENKGTKTDERQSLVHNLKDKSGTSVCGKDQSEVLRSLKEGISDIAKVCAEQEDEEESGYTHSTSVCTTKEDDAKPGCVVPSTENKDTLDTLQSDLSPVMEGCNSCSHIYKGSSKYRTSNSETQTANRISRSTVTDTDTSTHSTCSSQTAMQGQRNRSAHTSQAVAQGQSNSSVQTTCVQVTQECQITPDYRTTSCQTSFPKSNNIRRIIVKPWAARKYQDMCMCAELGSPCTCASRKSQALGIVLPRNSSWWPTAKKTLLIIAALIPWVFLIVYSVYYYRANY